MSWLRRLISPAETDGEEEELQAPPPPRPTEGAAPGLEALFSRLSGPTDRSILDLGAASPANLEMFRRVARRVRFADLAEVVRSGGAWKDVLEPLGHRDGHPYDVILAWDLLDHLLPEEHQEFVHRLTGLAADGAWLHLLVRATDETPSHPLRFTVCDVGRIRYEALGPAHPRHAPILPAQMERLLRPFRVVQGFTLKGGLREYLARKADES